MKVIVQLGKIYILELLFIFAWIIWFHCVVKDLNVFCAQNLLLTVISLYIWGDQKCCSFASSAHLLCIGSTQLVGCIISHCRLCLGPGHSNSVLLSIAPYFMSKFYQQNDTTLCFDPGCMSGVLCHLQDSQDNMMLQSLSLSVQYVIWLTMDGLW